MHKLAYTQGDIEGHKYKSNTDVDVGATNTTIRRKKWITYQLECEISKEERSTFPPKRYNYDYALL